MITPKKILILFVVLGGMVLAPSFLTFSGSSINENPRVSNLVKEPTLGCNSTNFELWTNETFARSTQLNEIFDQITFNPVIVKNITKKINDSTSYVISNIKSTLVYHNENQTSDIYLPQGLIAILNGFAQVDVRFDWARLGPNPANGSGTAQGISQQIAIAYKFNQKTGNLPKYELVEYLPFSCEKLTLIDLNGPFSEDDRQQINNIVSSNPNRYTLSTELKAEVNQLFEKYLGWSLNDQSPLTNEKFTYTWKNPAAASIIDSYNLTRKLNQFNFVFEELHYSYQTVIDDYPNASCGPQIAKNLFDKKVYGGLQSYVSLTFMQNILKTAASKYQLDTTLTRNFWITRNFNFMVGQLFDVIPNLSHFAPHIDVEGSCKTDNRRIKVGKFSNETFGVSLISSCNMSVRVNPRVQFASFEVALQLEVEPKAFEDTMEFWLKSFNSSISYLPQDNYPIANKQSADKMINSVLEKLYENELFGSGWHIYPNRLYPEILVENERLVIYEKSRK